MSVTEETRRESYEKLDNETLYKHIIEILQNGAVMSAKEIAVVMYTRNYIPYPVRQAVAPRLTELTDRGIIETAGKVYDYETKRNVAAYRLLVKP